jgi:hypothetical protein
MEFKVDNIDLIKDIKARIDKNDYSLDKFYTGVKLTAPTLEDLDLDLFGCWNSNCNDEFKESHSKSLHQKFLVNLLNKYNADAIAKNQLRFLFGDNLYFDKNIKEEIKKDENEELKKKLFKSGIPDKIPLLKLSGENINLKDVSEKLLEDGFNCMSQKPTFMCLGNHDIEPLFVLHQEIKKSYDTLKINENNTITFPSNWIQPTAFYSVELNVKNNSLLFVIIDTNLLDGEYKSDIYPDMIEKKKQMLKWLDETLFSHQNHLKIVIGHCPIFYFSHKDKGSKFLSRDIPSKEEMIGTNFVDLYKILVQHKVKIYMAADEHNLQHIYDAEHDIIHLTCGASPGGGGADETNNFKEGTNQEMVFSSSQIDIPDPVKQKMIKKLVLNSPSFMKLNVHNTMVQINLIGPSNLSQHSSLMCTADSKRCIENKPELENPEVYGIISIPKYLEYVSIYNCDKYKSKKCKN